MSNDRPDNATKIPRADFDQAAREKRFTTGPFVSSFGDGYGDPYIPPQKRDVWGVLDGKPVWADWQ